MREAAEIKEEVDGVNLAEKEPRMILQNSILMHRAILEVLLDSRQVLIDIHQLLQDQDPRPAVTHPVSPPPPEVKP